MGELEKAGEMGKARETVEVGKAVGGTRETAGVLGEAGEMEKTGETV